jgi:hypothetical protein
MTLQEHARLLHLEAAALDAAGRYKMAQLKRYLAQAALRLQWVTDAPPYTARSPKRRTRAAGPEVAAHYIALGRAALRERNV